MKKIATVALLIDGRSIPAGWDGQPAKTRIQCTDAEMRDVIAKANANGFTAVGMTLWGINHHKEPA